MTVTTPTFTRILRYFKAYWSVLLFAVIGMIISGLTESGFAALMKPLIDGNFSNTPGKHPNWWIPSLIILLFIIRGISTYINDYCSSWVSQKLISQLRNDMFDRILRLPSTWYDQSSTSLLISRISQEATLVASAGFWVLTAIVKDGITLIGLLALMFYTDWRLSLICLTVLPIVSISVWIVAKRIRKLAYNSQATINRLIEITTEVTKGHKIVKIFAGYDAEKKDFFEAADELRKTEVKQISASSISSNFVQLTIAIALAIIIIYASHRSESGHLSAGDFMSFLTAMLMLFAPIKRLTGVGNGVQRGLAAAQSVFQLLDTPCEKNKGQHSSSLEAYQIDFDIPNFTYPGNQDKSLREVKLSIPCGKTYAIVGASESGKSTLAALLPQFYTLQQGEIKIGGVPIDHFSLDDLRSMIAYVSQDVVLFNDSIENNVRYGSNQSKADLSLLEALKNAHALEFIEKLPQGIQTQVGENGARLSGGQKQRIAIARAFLKNSPILVLDEATSSLDNESERLVQEALKNLSLGRTTLIIAHRLSTIEHADQIIVMDKGCIVEQGVHSELIQLNGIYKHLHQAQQKEHA